MFEQVRLGLSLIATEAVKQSLEFSQVITDSGREVMGEGRGGGEMRLSSKKNPKQCSVRRTVHFTVYRALYSVQ